MQLYMLIIITLAIASVEAASNYVSSTLNIYTIFKMQLYMFIIVALAVASVEAASNYERLRQWLWNDSQNLLSSNGIES